VTCKRLQRGCSPREESRELRLPDIAGLNGEQPSPPAALHFKGLLLSCFASRALHLRTEGAAPSSWEQQFPAAEV